VTRAALLRRARLLSIASVVLSGALGGVAVVIGLTTGRLSLLGFGFDAAIDSVASIVLVWRFQIETQHPARAERAERLAEQVLGGVLLALAAYLVFSAGRALLAGTHPESEEIGLAISLASIVLLPPLAVAKNRVAGALDSGALRADSILTGIAALLAAVSIAGFLLTESAGIWWADAVAALLVAGVLTREGFSPFRRRGFAGEEAG
jgi:divalent metal cation (Fe/Co/Zn/Cd) transporter